MPLSARIIALLSLSTVFVVGSYVLLRHESVKPPVTSEVLTNETVHEPISAPEWSMYESEKMKVSFDHPASWKIQEAELGQSGAYSLVLSSTGQSSPIFNGIEVDYWPDASKFLATNAGDLPESKALVSLDEYFALKNENPLPGLKIDGSDVYSFGSGAMGPEFNIVTEHGGVYNVIFIGKEQKDLTPDELRFLSSLSFLN